MPAEQGKLFLAMVGTGMCIGILYDVFRMLRRMFKMGRFFTALMDLLFWLLATIIAGASILFFAQGDLRGFLVIGMGVGGALHLGVVSPIWAAIIRLIRRLIPEGFVNKIKR